MIIIEVEHRIGEGCPVEKLINFIIQQSPIFIISVLALLVAGLSLYAIIHIVGKWG
jgi:hypothetical protein